MLSVLSALALLKQLIVDPRPVSGATPSPDTPPPGPSYPTGLNPIAEPVPAASATGGSVTPEIPSAGGPPLAPDIGYAVSDLAPPAEGFGPKGGTTFWGTATDTNAVTVATRPNSAAVRSRRTPRRKARAGARGYRDEFLDSPETLGDGSGIPAHAMAGDQGAGACGFAPSAPHGMGRTIKTVPLLPGTWATD